MGFGFVPSWNVVVHHSVTQLGYSLSELDEVCGVRNAEGKTAVGSIFTLSIPYRTAGEIRGFIFRRAGESDGPKYMANRGLDRKSRFFNIPSALPGKEIVVVEGELDALKAESAGLGCPVVAIGGSEIAGERRRQIEDALSRGVERITLCLDLDGKADDPAVPDLASLHEHVMRSVHTIKDVSLRFDEIYVAVFPEVTDPDEYIRGRGADAFRSLVASAVPYWKYEYDYRVSADREPAGFGRNLESFFFREPTVRDEVLPLQHESVSREELL